MRLEIFLCFTLLMIFAFADLLVFEKYDPLQVFFGYVLGALTYAALEIKDIYIHFKEDQEQKKCL